MRSKFLPVLFLVMTIVIVVIYGGTEAKASEMTVAETDNLQEILDQAKDGDELILEPGVYEGNFIVDASVAIVGKEGALIKGSGEGDVITVNADGVTIDNLEIEQGGSQNAGIYLRSDRNTIQNNKLFNVFHGIVVRGGYGNMITENVITSFKDTPNKGFGIYLIEAPNSRVTNNYLYDTNDGIYISYSDLCDISQNQIKKARYGIHTMDSKDVFIAENDVSLSRNGLMIMQSYNLQIKKNYLYANTTLTGVGIFLFDTFNSNIQANIIKKNNKGIFLENAVENLIEFNMIEGNEKGIEAGKNSNDNQINLNNFISNNQQVISNEENKNEFSWDGFGNYWDNQRSLNLSENDTNDYAFKSGDVFYHLTAKDAHLQIFSGSPAVGLWNTVEQFVPIASDKFIVDEHPLATPAAITIESGEVSKAQTFGTDISWTLLLIFTGFVSFSLFIFNIARRRHDE